MSDTQSSKQARYRVRKEARGIRQRNFMLSEREDKTLSSVLPWLRSTDPYKPPRVVIGQDGTIWDIRAFL